VLLELLSLAFRDLAIAGEGIAPLSGMDAAVLDRWRPARPPGEWGLLLERAQAAAEDLSQYVDPRLAVEALLADVMPARGASR
jgi:hypothetical protein